MPAPAYVIGCGLTTCLGSGLVAQLPALRATRPRPPQPGADGPQPTWPYHSIVQSAGPSRLYDILHSAVDQALQDSGLSPDERGRMALFIGSSCLDLPLHEQAYADGLAAGHHPIAIQGPGYGTMAARLAGHFHINGPQYTISTACSSSANALLHAQLVLNAGLAEHALVVGIEAFNQLSVQGFGSLLLLSRKDYQPFDRDRTGLILGEGAGAIVLAASPRSGAQPRFAVRGGNSACDPSSPTNSRPDRVAAVMAAALADARTQPQQLLALKAHGTATASNDLVEGQAMRMLIPQPPPFTSLKPYVGHTLGACGVIETLLLMAAWQDGFLPGTPGFSTIDPEIGLAPVTAARPLAPEGAVLCNFFGFGGNNTCLVLSR